MSVLGYTVTMINKFDPVDVAHEEEHLILVHWSELFAVGIDMIDHQHKELVRLTNHLYESCLTHDDAIGTIFKDAMEQMVDYVRFHFTAELKLLERIRYPDYHEHKQQHDQLVKQILEAAKEYKEGKKFVPNNFVRALKDWVFGHIAIYDQNYAAYVREQKQKGLLTDKEING